MSENQVLDTIKQLSHSQGFYGRLLQRLEEVKGEDPDLYQEFMEQCKNCKNPVDLVMMIEG